jgi:U3 small nucleolar RNA-associated protein 22
MLSRRSYEQNPHDIEPAMFLATSYDKSSEAWTKHSPSKSVGIYLFCTDEKPITIIEF